MDSNSSATCPVVDFDLFGACDPAASDDALERCATTGCPVVWTEDNGGHWIVGTYGLVADAFRDWERFSSERRHPGQNGNRLQQQQPPPCLPEESDPPHWYGYRRALATILSPQASERLRGRARHWTQHCLDQVVERGESSSSTTSPAVVPARGHARVARLPARTSGSVLRHLPRHLRVPGRIARTPRSVEGVRAGARPDRRRSCDDRIASPRDDALTAIAHHEIDGVRLPEEIAQSIAFLTTVGGIDTTTVAGRRRAVAPVAASGRPPAADRRSPTCFPSPPRNSFATIRRRAPTSASSPSTPSSVVSTMKAGDDVLLSEVAAGRDESEFPERRRVRDRPQPEPPRVVRRRHPPLPGLTPRAHHVLGDDRRGAPTHARLPASTLDEVVDYPDWAMVGGWQRMPATFTPTPRALTVRWTSR